MLAPTPIRSVLAEHHALVIGAGGLGGPIALSLAQGGIGQLSICDDDVVELSNLQRQIQFTTDDVGKSKVQALGNVLRHYKGTTTKLHRQRFTKDTQKRLCEDVSIIIDGSDNFATKFLCNDSARALGIPCVISAAIRYTGQVMTIRPEAACYRCFFESPPPDESCSRSGVLGPICGIIGGTAAKCALKLLRSPSDESSESELLVFENLPTTLTPRRVRFRPRKHCSACEQTLVMRTHKTSYQKETYP